MQIKNLNARYAMNLCARYTALSGSRLRDLASTQQINNLSTPVDN
jgi:hypothetical protein